MPENVTVSCKIRKDQDNGKFRKSNSLRTRYLIDSNMEEIDETLKRNAFSANVCYIKKI